ncbi:hypothetical protein EIL50_03410 [bacterium NHP-B]|nr:hypothetical protein EIL50_03410 [bacterium NHP-B]
MRFFASCLLSAAFFVGFTPLYARASDAGAALISQQIEVPSHLPTKPGAIDTPTIRDMSHEEDGFVFIDDKTLEALRPETWNHEDVASAEPLSHAHSISDQEGNEKNALNEDTPTSFKDIIALEGGDEGQTPDDNLPSYAEAIALEEDDLGPLSIIDQKPEEAIHDAVDLCDMSYKKGRDWKRLLKAEKKKGHKIYTFGTSYERRSGFVRARKDGSFDVIFRGTKTGADMLIDAHATWAIDDETGHRVHNGFLNHTKAVLPEVIRILSKHALKNGITSTSRMKVNLVGHSLGGATAQLAIPYIDQLFDLGDVTTFGAPMTYDAQSAQHINKAFSHKIDNFYQNYDPVPYAGAVNPLRGVRPELFLLPEAEPVGQLFPLPTWEAVHKVKGYRTSLEALDKIDGYTYAPQPKKGIAQRVWTGIKRAPVYVEHHAHKALAYSKNAVLSALGYRH